MDRIIITKKQRGAAPAPYRTHYIGRGGRSSLDNPFASKPSRVAAVATATPAESVARFEVYLAEQLLTDTPQRREIDALAAEVRGGGVVALECWCLDERDPHPERHVCHGRAVRAAVLARV